MLLKKSGCFQLADTNVSTPYSHQVYQAQVPTGSVHLFSKGENLFNPYSIPTLFVEPVRIVFVFKNILKKI